VKESVVERHLVRRVRKMDGEVFKIQFIGRRGAPDRLVLFPDGESHWVELKAPGKKAEPHQERLHAVLRGMLQSVLVLDSIEAVNKAFPLH
jgi:hypothetical protein